MDSIFLTLAVIVAGCGAARWLARRVQLPGVVGEILFGVALGPSLLGWMSPRFHAALFPASGTAVLEAFAWVGLVLFAFLIGLELEWGLGRAKATLLVGTGALLFPVVAGMALALRWPSWFFPGALVPAGMAMLAVALTVSALPVLARILEDLNLTRHPVGSVALGAATMSDVSGWLLMALLLGTGASHLTGNVWLDLIAVAGCGVLVFALGNLLRARLAHRAAPKGLAFTFVPILAGALGSAWMTDAAGLNVMLGPLALGAAVGRLQSLREVVRRSLGDLTRAVFLPVFFVVSGASADLRLLLRPSLLVGLLVVASVATAAKVLGAYLGALGAGLDRRSGLAAGFLLNARGAVGLVVAKVGLDAGIFSASGYALLVLVVVFTTIVSPVAARLVLLHGPNATANPPP